MLSRLLDTFEGVGTHVGFFMICDLLKLRKVLLCLIKAGGSTRATPNRHPLQLGLGIETYDSWTGASSHDIAAVRNV